MKAKQLVNNLKAKYSSCDSYSDSGTIIVSDNQYTRQQTSEFRTFYTNPSKLLFSISTQKAENDTSEVVYWMNGDDCYFYEDRNGTVSSNKIDKTLGKIQLNFESQPCFSLPLLIPGFKYVTNEVFENNFVIGKRIAEYYHLVCECRPLGRVDLWIDKTSDSLAKIYVERVKSIYRGSTDLMKVECEYQKVLFNEKISDDIFDFKGK